MKDDSMTPSDVKTSNPLPTPQPSTVKLEEEIRECPHCKGSLERYEDPKAVKIIESLHSQLAPAKAEIRELRKENEELKDSLEAQSTYAHSYLTELQNAQAQLRRKDEALEKIHDCEKYLKHPSDCLAHATGGDACDCGKDAIMCLTRDALAALADGKEGDQKKELEACQWCKKLVSHLIQITDKPDLHDARICEDCYSKEFPEVDGKEGGE